MGTQVICSNLTFNLLAFLKLRFQDHEKKCEYVLVPCSFRSCKTKIQQKVELIEAHKARCDFRPVPCTYCAKTYQSISSEVINASLTDKNPI